MKNQTLGVILALLLAGSLGAGFLIGTKNVQTIITTNTSTYTYTLTETMSGACHSASPVPSLPVGDKWFTGVVYYSGEWVAVLQGYAGHPPPFSKAYSGCFQGNGTGRFEVDFSNSTSPALLTVTVYKLDSSMVTLQMYVNGNGSSTSIPWGSASITVAPDGRTTSQTSSESGSTTAQVTNSPAHAYMSYQPCITGYSGFEVTRQYPNPSTWTFELYDGTIGYLHYGYEVTMGIDYFLKFLSYPWWISQTYQNGSSILAEVNGSTVIHVQYDVPNQFPVIRPNNSNPLTVQLSLENYSANGNSVEATWAVTGLIPGTYQIESNTLEWHTTEVAPSTEMVNATSETFTDSCGGTVVF